MPDVRRAFPWLLVAGLLLAAPPVAAEEEPETTAILIPTTWLGLPSLDGAGRAPFNPSRVFERYLWRLDAQPPRAGEGVKGVSGKEGTWKTLQPDPKGNVDPAGAGVIYGTVEVEEAGVWLAEVFRASSLYVNGAPHCGDVYGHRITKVPVFLKKGVNHLYAAGFRGKVRIVLARPVEPVFLAPWDATLPDLVAGGGPWSPGSRLAGVMIVNATPRPVSELSLRNVRIERGEKVVRAPTQMSLALPSIPPGGMWKLPAVIPTGPFALDGPEPRLVVELVHGSKELVDAASWPLEVRSADDAHRRTFLSDVDDSVQFYGVRPATAGGDATRLVLSLHGAGVDALNQARSYSPRPDFHVVAATNRRPYGFDWQDWGRRDAYEVLEDALRVTTADPRRVYLTGHSMGGHGTWHLAANDPDRFAAAAPSAGWISFDTYGGRPQGPLTQLWHAADRASLTLDLLTNLADLPLYVLHGSKDDNVPPREAKTMQKALKDIAKDATFHFEEGAGHWWNGEEAEGTDCVDWPPLFETFRKHERPERPEAIDVTFADLSQDSTHHWIHVQQPIQYGHASHVKAHRSPPDAVVIETKNVRRLTLLRPKIWGRPQAHIDGQVFDPPEEAGVPEAFAWRDGAWSHTPSAMSVEPKRPERMGPFKRAFDRGFLLVYGTKGDPCEDLALLQRARYDAERWRYRANGSVACLTDTEFLHRAPGHDVNVILYGNADTNDAWSAVVPDACPFEPRRGKVTIGVKTWTGDDYGLLFVYPRKDSDGALVAAVADTGVPGSRLTLRPSYFTSGVGIPDFVLFGKEILTQGDAGVRVAGFLDHEWKLAD